jgi:hypothetical protein
MMAAVEKQSEDGFLPAALRRLEDAVTALVDERSAMSGLADCVDCRMDRCPGHATWVDSWYDQLRDSLPGEQGGGHSGSPRSLPPAWVDAVKMLMEIDTAVQLWQRDPGVFDGDLTPGRPPTPETVRRLRLIQARAWRPQDVDKIDDLTKNLEEWVAEIKVLFSTEPVRALWAAEGGGFAACPQCGKTMAHKIDSAGDRVQYPAMQVLVDGSTRCMACKTSWGAEHAMWVCRMLGYPTPAGVLE